MFLIVGLAAASIVLFLFFFIQRRRRNRRLEYDTAVASTLAAAGLNRTPVDGDDDEEGKVMSQRRRSSPSAIRTMSSIPSLQPYTDDPSGRPRDFDPYAAYGAVPPQTPPASARRDGYFPARTNSPPLVHSHSASTSSMSGAMGHMARESAGSHEPLLLTPGPSAVGGAPLIPPKSPKRTSATPPAAPAPIRDSASSTYSNNDDGEGDDQLVDLTPRQPLEVRNLPDGQRPGADISREPTRRTVAR